MFSEVIRAAIDLRIAVEGVKVGGRRESARGEKEGVRMGAILYSIWAISLNLRELNLAAEEAIVGVASGRELKRSECSLRFVTSGG